MMDLAWSDVTIGLGQGLKYCLLVIGACVTLRVARFPDIGIEGAFALGACSVPPLFQLGLPWPVAIVAGAILGALAGLLTAGAHLYLKINALVAGIITVLVSFSACFVLLGFRGTAPTYSVVQKELSHSLLPYPTVDLSGIIGGALLLALVLFFSTRSGVVLRFASESPELLRSLGRRGNTLRLTTVVLGNALVGISGALAAAIDGSASLFIGRSMLFVAVSALVLGEATCMLLGGVSWWLLRCLGGGQERLRNCVEMFAGGGVSFLLVSGFVGSSVYYVLFAVVTSCLGAVGYSKLVVGLTTGGLLVVSGLWLTKGGRHYPWRFV